METCRRIEIKNSISEENDQIVDNTALSQAQIILS